MALPVAFVKSQHSHLCAFVSPRGWRHVLDPSWGQSPTFGRRRPALGVRATGKHPHLSQAGKNRATLRGHTYAAGSLCSAISRATPRRTMASALGFTFPAWSRNPVTRSDTEVYLRKSKSHLASQNWAKEWVGVESEHGGIR